MTNFQRGYSTENSYDPEPRMRPVSAGPRVPVAEGSARPWQAFWRGVVIGGLAVGALVYSLPAYAQTRMTLEAPTANCFAVVAIQNRYGVYNADEVLVTRLGPVTLSYDTIGGHNAIDADQITVVSLPEGVVADPMSLALPDGETGRVCLIEWLGG